MNNRDRLLAVIQRKELDRVPFIQYDGIAAPNSEIWSVIGRENMGILRWSSVHAVHYPNCRFKSERFEHDGRSGTKTTIHTPAGDLTEESLDVTVLGVAAKSKHFVREPKDYAALKALLEDAVVVDNTQQFMRDRKELGEDGLPHVSLMRTPFQQMWIEWVSLEDFCIHLMDCPEIVEECMALMARNIRRVLDIVRESPVPYVVFPDNITAPVIGEKNFRKYCMPLYNEAAEVLSDRDIPVFVHMDGDLQPLSKAIAESGVRGLDSFSPPPDNDTSPAQALAQWPDMRLLMNFPSSLHLASPQEIRERADELLAEAGHSGRFVVAVSENVPPGAWIKSYPEIVKAIDTFGKP